MSADTSLITNPETLQEISARTLDACTTVKALSDLLEKCGDAEISAYFIRALLLPALGQLNAVTDITWLWHTERSPIPPRTVQ